MYPLSVRLRLIPLLLAAAPFASADRLINLETARKLMAGTYRFEYQGEFSEGRTQMGYVGLGLDKSWELDLRSERIGRASIKSSADLVYNLVSPLAGLSPGVAFGVQDLAGSMQDGRQFFGCLTFREEDESPRGSIYQDTTIGVLVGRKTTPYLAESFPFSPEFRLLFEVSGIRAQAGFEIRPVHNLSLRMIAREKDLMGSVGYSVRF